MRTEVRIGYIRLYKLHPSETLMLMTHTADEATLDGEIQSQYLVNVSSVTLKNE